MPPRVKICGVTTVADALLAARLGADAVGLNLFAGSKRSVSEDVAGEIIAALPPLVEPVLVVVNESWGQITARLQRLPTVRTVQIHGDTIVPCPAGGLCRWIPAFAIKGPDSIDAITSLLTRCRETDGVMPTAVLVDGHQAGSYGGTGQTAPWPLIASLTVGVPLFLAGGLTPDNVADAVRIARPFAVDVASGVESSPGRKDEQLMRRFIAAAKSATPQDAVDQGAV